MKWTAFAVRRSVTTVMLILVFVVLGIFSYSRLTVDLFPNIDFPYLTITTIYPGAGPSEVKSQVTEKIEDEISSVSNVKNLDSTSREGVSIILIEFELGVDVDLASIEVKDKVDAILSDLPEDIEQPEIVKFDINALPIMNLSISADSPLNEVYEYVDTTVRDRLNKIDGLASVEVVGGLVREIQVNVSREALIRHNLTITEFANLIGAENKDVPLGRLTSKDEEFVLRVSGEFTSIEDIKNTTIATPTGASVRLSDIAEIVDGFAERRESAKFQGKPSVGIAISKRSDANTVLIAAEVFQAIYELRQTMPEGYEIGIARDLSAFIVDSVNDVIINLILGIIITAFFLYIFLHNIWSTLIATLDLPTSIIATFILIYFAGFTINVITLMALGISIGILATNDIIILESINRHIKAGEPPKEAAIKGTSEVAIAVGASTLTNIMVFTPIAFMSGIVGQFFKQFGLTVVFATIFSLLVSFTMTPMLASKLLGQKKKGAISLKFSQLKYVSAVNKRLLLFFERWDKGYDNLVLKYRSSLNWCLKNKKKAVMATVGILFFSFFLIALVGGEFFPYSDRGYLSINVELPPGVRIEETEEVIGEISGIVGKYEEIETLFSTVGGENKGVNEGQLILRLVDISERDILTKDFVNKIRYDLANIPGADIGIMEESGGGEAEADLVLNVTGPDIKTISALAGEMEEIVKDMEGLVDVETSEKLPSPEIRFIPDRFKIASYGVNSSDIYTILRASYEGIVPSLYKEGGEEYDIKVRLSEEDRSEEDVFGEIRIKTPKGMVPIEQLGEVFLGRGESEIKRHNRQDLVEVMANVGSGTVGEFEKKIEDEAKKIDTPEGYAFKLGGQSETKAESFASLYQALLLAVILTYIVLAAILESFVHPITIMLTLPLGLIGTAVGLFVGGQTINMLSLMAMIMLVGIVVNNAILILDYTSILRDGGMSCREAIVEASPVRLRPIIMANLAIAFAIIPQALGGAEAGHRTAMAFVTMGGVLFSAVFTIYLIPVVYEFFDKFTIKGREEAKIK
ncbi:MAG: efflux RND transporter permease subunit [Deltaproteobacteria bacterium]|uniref:Efflux RND transporter permease subunit n=1 Tax=Candidatus Zymogenus saltonus TaxID=2844893 RepID=A0A9D8KFF6_9DELT|nr:efflux RND transporter permease subunit [Candidatus Zymogenus saltonus]